uniref:Uncharacterized protein n=1 Tax=Rhizophora mucronata TaxID=61149 RepID=A0A2P2KJJ1_RHIMU
MVLLISGTRIANKDLRPCHGVLNPYPAVPSTMMAQYLHIQSATTGVRVQKITTQQWPKLTFIYICLRSLKSKPSHGLEQVVEGSSCRRESANFN